MCTPIFCNNIKKNYLNEINTTDQKLVIYINALPYKSK